METANIVIVSLLVVMGAFINTRASRTRSRSVIENVWILFTTFGPSILSAFLLGWWTFFITLAVTFVLIGIFGNSIRKQAPSSRILKYATLISTITEHFYESISRKSSIVIKRSDVILDITAYCLYITFKELLSSKRSITACREVVEQLAKHISFYIEHDVSFSNLYIKQFMVLTEKLGIDSTPEEYRARMIEYVRESYHLDETTSVLETGLIKKLENLLDTKEFVGAI